jgi:hypothetical protein
MWVAIPEFTRERNKSGLNWEVRNYQLPGLKKGNMLRLQTTFSVYLL